MKLFKKSVRPLPIALKLVFAYTYLYLLLGVVAIIVSADHLDEFSERGFVLSAMDLAISMLSTFLAGWALYLFYKRKALATTVFIVCVVATTSLASQSELDQSTIWSALIFLVLDLLAVVYLLRSKEARKVLNQ